MLRFIINCISGLIDNFDNTCNVPSTIRTVLREKQTIRDFTQLPHFEQRAHLEVMEERYRRDLAHLKEQISTDSIEPGEAKQRLAVVSAALRRVGGLRARLDMSESTVCNVRALHILSDTVQTHQFIKDNVRSTLPNGHELMRQRVREETRESNQEVVRDYLTDLNESYAQELAEEGYSPDPLSYDVTDCYIETKLQGLGNLEIPVTILP